jgi:hypothetical protein
LSLALPCLRGASLEETLREDSTLAASMPAIPATWVQPEDHRNALDMKASQKEPMAMKQAQTAGTLNLNIRYGQMTMALVAQAAIHQMRQRLGEPFSQWDASH